jgi:hypothetical protein
MLSKCERDFMDTRYMWNAENFWLTWCAVKNFFFFSFIQTKEKVFRTIFNGDFVALWLSQFNWARRVSRDKEEKNWNDRCVVDCWVQLRNDKSQMLVFFIVEIPPHIISCWETAKICPLMKLSIKIYYTLPNWSRILVPPNQACKWRSKILLIATIFIYFQLLRYPLHFWCSYLHCAIGTTVIAKNLNANITINRVNKRDHWRRVWSTSKWLVRKNGSSKENFICLALLCNQFSLTELLYCEWTLGLR